MWFINDELKMPDWEPTGNWREWPVTEKNAVKPTFGLTTKEEEMTE